MLICQEENQMTDVFSLFLNVELFNLVFKGMLWLLLVLRQLRSNSCISCAHLFKKMDVHLLSKHPTCAWTLFLFYLFVSVFCLFVCLCFVCVCVLFWFCLHSHADSYMYGNLSQLQVYIIYYVTLYYLEMYKLGCR